MHEHIGVYVMAVSGEGLGYFDRMFLFTLVIYTHTDTQTASSINFSGFIYQPHTHTHRLQ